MAFIQGQFKDVGEDSEGTPGALMSRNKYNQMSKIPKPKTAPRILGEPSAKLNVAQKMKTPTPIRPI